MTYALFEAEIARISDILSAVNLLTWDSLTKMPAAAVEARGLQIATLVDLARSVATGDRLQRSIETARAELAQADPLDRRRQAVEQAAASLAILARIPAALVGEIARLKTVAQAAWAQARARDDFAAFAPTLERTLDLQRQMAEAIGYGGDGGHPYDALIGCYEPGMTWARLQDLFAALRSGILPLFEQARDARVRTDILERTYPVDRQRRFSSAIAARLGYDFDRGRLDDTVHPFEIPIDRSDVRITGRFRETYLPGGLFAVWHEAGHGMYEQGIAPSLSRSVFAMDLVTLYGGGGTSFGTHESQSRLWENRVCRSRTFWDLHFGALRAEFPEALADVGAEDFWRAVNAPRPGLIRVEADELTYDLHIMLRSEIEAELLAGTLRVGDLPGVWRDKVKASLGLDVPNDRLGVLQDVHWSAGLVGYFPSYTVGNVMASQFFAAATRDAAVARGLESGDYQPLNTWLTDRVHCHGRSKSPSTLLIEATGEDLSVAPYLADLARKVEALAAAA